LHGVSEVKGSFRIAGSHGMIDTLNPGDAWTEDRRFICEVGVRTNGGRLSLGEQIGRACRTTGQDRRTGRIEEQIPKDAGALRVTVEHLRLDALRCRGCNTFSLIHASLANECPSEITS